MSGGIDSAALVPFYQTRDVDLCALHFDYGQPTAEAERRAVEAICEHYALTLAIQSFGIPLPCETGEFRARNALFLIAAAAIEPGSSAIAIGIHAGTPYYDCSEAFVEDLRRVFDGYFGGSVSIDAPFLAFDKRHICEFARRAEVPLDLTFSCERTNDAPCGECPSCRDRLAYLGCP
jgi:7-cyano-7-deazaguanine synthase